MAEKFRRSWLSVAIETAFVAVVLVAVFYGIPGARHWVDTHSLLASVLVVIFVLCEMFVANSIMKKRWARRHG